MVLPKASTAETSAEAFPAMTGAGTPMARWFECRGVTMIDADASCCGGSVGDVMGVRARCAQDDEKRVLTVIPRERTGNPLAAMPVIIARKMNRGRGNWWRCCRTVEGVTVSSRDSGGDAAAPKVAPSPVAVAGLTRTVAVPD